MEGRTDEVIEKQATKRMLDDPRYVNTSFFTRHLYSGEQGARAVLVDENIYVCR